MNLIWSRALRSTYRREPVVSFIATAGVVAAAIGGFGEHWSLVTFGLGSVGGAIALRWWQRQHRQAVVLTNRAPLYALPARSSRPSLPILSLPKRTSPGRRH